MTIDAAIREAVADAVAPLAREIHELRQRIAPPPEWVSINEAARHYDVTTATIRNWIRSGKIEARGVGKQRQVKVS